jgi:hypothetical protein
MFIMATVFTECKLKFGDRAKTLFSCGYEDYYEQQRLGL